MLAHIPRDAMSDGKRTHCSEMLIKPIKHKYLSLELFSFRSGAFFPMWPDSQFTTHFSFDVFFSCDCHEDVFIVFVVLLLFHRHCAENEFIVWCSNHFFPSSAYYHLLSAGSFDVHNSRSRCSMADGRWPDVICVRILLSSLFWDILSVFVRVWVDCVEELFIRCPLSRHWIPGPERTFFTFVTHWTSCCHSKSVNVCIFLASQSVRCNFIRPEQCSNVINSTFSHIFYCAVGYVGRRLRTMPMAKICSNFMCVIEKMYWTQYRTTRQWVLSNSPPSSSSSIEADWSEWRGMENGDV